MATESEQQLARVFFAEDAAWNGERLVHLLPRRLRDQGLAGCTLLRSAMGFGLHGRVHADLAEVSPPHGVVLEVVDAPDRIEALLALCDEVLEDGLVTVERARVLRLR